MIVNESDARQAMSVDTGRWMISVPGTPGQVTQHFIPPRSATRSYASSYAYVAPCGARPLCIPADANCRRGIPLCPACSTMPKTRI